MADINHNTAINILPIIKKCLKKSPQTGVIESHQWYQFKYRVTGIKFNDDKYYWNRVLYVNIEVSEKYWASTNEWRYIPNFMWSSTRRNKYIRCGGKQEVQKFFNLFSFPYRVEIGAIKIIKE